MSVQKQIGISIIIPLYNAKPWIGSTLEHIAVALQDSLFDAEVIVIDDGSSDGGADTAEAFEAPKNVSLRVVKQKNTGRYLARKRGIELSTKENILFIDSRVYVDAGALRYLSEQLKDDSDQLWNGHVNIDKAGNPFARFWDAIVCIAWRRYFRHPAPTTYGLKDFDFYPKGTGFFYVPKKRLLAAMDYFESQTNDLEFSSDDTLLIRYMIREKDIHLSPSFSCLYHGRSDLNKFLKHAYHRGQFFIDGFLRPGNRFFLPLIGVLFLSVVGLAALVMFPLILLPWLGLALLLFVLGLFLGALFFGVIVADSASLAMLGVPFAVVYLAGLWRGVIRMVSGKTKEGVK